jgi:hypothetical protein
VVTGSTTVFAALLDRLAARDLVAVARLIPRVGSEPRFVALLPQVCVHMFLHLCDSFKLIVILHH